MGKRPRRGSLLQRTWRGRLPADQPAGVEPAGWVLLVLHVEGGKPFRTLAAELGLDYNRVRAQCYRAATQLQRHLAEG